MSLSLRALATRTSWPHPSSRRLTHGEWVRLDGDPHRLATTEATLEGLRGGRDATLLRDLTALGVEEAEVAVAVAEVDADGVAGLGRRGCIFPWAYAGVTPYPRCDLYETRCSAFSSHLMRLRSLASTEGICCCFGSCRLFVAINPLFEPRPIRLRPRGVGPYGRRGHSACVPPPRAAGRSWRRRWTRREVSG